MIAIPTNRPLRRLNHPDVIYRTEREKYAAIADEIERMHKWDVLVDEQRRRVSSARSSSENRRRRRVPGEREQATARSIPESKIEEIERRGRPILVGTVSIERSELISGMLDKRGIKHQVLNAKHHQREAEIVAQAGRKGAVTIATNMAGRGTDIILGGNPEAMAWAQLQEKYPTRLEVPQDEWDALVHEIEQREQMKAEGREVAAMGGLHIIGSERHEARRIDLQLRGRCGRQGDPGSSRFYLSLEDDLMRIFAGEWVKNILTRLGMKEGEAIESRMVSRRIEGAPEEGRRAQLRHPQKPARIRRGDGRAAQAGLRLPPADPRRRQLQAADPGHDRPADRALPRPVPRQGLRHRDVCRVGGQGVGGRVRRPRFPRHGFPAGRDATPSTRPSGWPKARCSKPSRRTCPRTRTAAEWNWEALAKMANTRWHLSLRDRDLKQVGRERVGEFLIEKAREALSKVDLGDGAAVPGSRLRPADGLRAGCGTSSASS